MEQLKKFWSDEQGLETVEYAIIAGLIVVHTKIGTEIVYDRTPCRIETVVRLVKLGPSKLDTLE